MRTRHRIQKFGSHGRRGYLFAAVMMVSLMVSIIGFTAMRMAASGMRTAAGHADFEEARLLARAAVELGKNRVDRTPSWRTTFVNETPSAAIPYGAGSFTWKLVDDDASLSDDDTDSVWVVGTGTVGGATYSERVRLIPAGGPLGCLEASLCTNADLSLTAGRVVETDQLLHVNGNVTVSGAGTGIEGDVHATGTATGSISGAIVAGAGSRSLPGSDVVDYYLDHGTWIDVDNLPENGSSEPVIDRAVLSPDLNPFGGGTNPEGIYVIDCEGESLRVRESRIVGTLVLLNPGASTGTSLTVHWSPAVPHYPALLVQGNFRLAHTSSTLSEGSIGTNLNPAGAPHHGVADGDTGDSYPSRIRGLVHVSGTLTYPFTGGVAKVDGVVVAGSVAASSDAEFDYSDVHRNHAPPGFRTGTAMAISPSSWQRVIAP